MLRIWVLRMIALETTYGFKAERPVTGLYSKVQVRDAKGLLASLVSKKSTKNLNIKEVEFMGLNE